MLINISVTFDLDTKAWNDEYGVSDDPRSFVEWVMGTRLGE